MQWTSASNWKIDWAQAKEEKEYVKTDKVRKFSSLFLDFFFHEKGKPWRVAIQSLFSVIFKQLHIRQILKQRLL